MDVPETLQAGGAAPAIRWGRMPAALRQFGRVSAGAAPMHSLFDVLDRLAPTDVTILLIGETGTGKDVLAREIHQRSHRSNGPFVVFDCGAVAANLAESELLGHEKGSFTGAHVTRSGAFERANGGTIFLDEVGELPMELQPRLLRVLENRQVRRVGGSQEKPIDVRVVAATNRNLRREIVSRSFREDLYFRLTGAEVFVPPLRDRLEDLEPLTLALLADLGHPELRVPPETLQAIAAHSWPGNVRELKNTLARAAHFAENGMLSPAHLNINEPLPESSAVDRLPLGGQPWHEIERAAILQTLELVGGNKVKAAKALGIAPSTLYEKLKKLE